MPTYAEIMAKIEELQAQAKQVREADLKAAIGQIKELMEKHGITIADIQDKAAKTKKTSTVAAKYRDPASGKEWSGRGRTPNWLEGKNRDEFKI